MNKCKKCVADKSCCSICRDSPKVQKILASLPKQSYFMYYKPIYPHGDVDYIWDPDYIHFHYPDWYKELYRDLKPKVAIKQENSCIDKVAADLSEKYYYYDFD